MSAVEQIEVLRPPRSASARGLRWVLDRRSARGGGATAVQPANFVFWAEAIQPLGAVCFEDMQVQPLEPPPVDKEIAAFADHAFTVRVLAARSRCSTRRAMRAADARAWQAALRSGGWRRHGRSASWLPTRRPLAPVDAARVRTGAGRRPTRRRPTRRRRRRRRKQAAEAGRPRAASLTPTRAASAPRQRRRSGRFLEEDARGCAWSSLCSATVAWRGEPPPRATGSEAAAGAQCAQRGGGDGRRSKRGERRRHFRRQGRSGFGPRAIRIRRERSARDAGPHLRDLGAHRTLARDDLAEVRAGEILARRATASCGARRQLGHPSSAAGRRFGIGEMVTQMPPCERRSDRRAPARAAEAAQRPLTAQRASATR